MTKEDVFIAVANVDRRRILVTLLTEDAIQVAALTGRSRELSGADEGLLSKHLSSGREVPGANEEHLRLHHVHLPMLAEYGFIEWDAEAHMIRKGPRFAEVRQLVEPLSEIKKTTETIR